MEAEGRSQGDGISGCLRNPMGVSGIRGNFAAWWVSAHFPMLTRGLGKKGTFLERLRDKGGGRLQGGTRWNAGRVRARDSACPTSSSVCPLWFLRRPA